MGLASLDPAAIMPAMMSIPPQRLIPHPVTKPAFALDIQVTVAFLPAGELVCTFAMTGELDRIVIPKSLDSRRVNGLWRHTCFEVFIQGEDMPAYREFNFSPSGQWQAYAFSSYRQGGALDTALGPLLTRQDDVGQGSAGPDGAGQLVLECRIPRAALPQGQQWRAGLTAVVEDADRGLSYWALRHPPGKPDFHHTDGFALTLQRP